MNTRKLWTTIFTCVAACILVFSGLGGVSPASGSMLFDATLQNGDYGAGWAVPECSDFMIPDPAPPGVVNGADGVEFVTTEISGASSALINWEVGSPLNMTFRNNGTISFSFYANSSTHVGGTIVCDNYGFNAFRGGQGAFSIWAYNVGGQVEILWTVLLGSWVHFSPRVYVAHDEWHNLSFAWGGQNHDFEICVDGQLAASYMLPAGESFPWGVDWGNSSGYNIGLGSNHERDYVCTNLLPYGSAAGVKFADIEIWDEYLPCQGNSSDLAITKTAAPNPVETNAQQIFTIEVTNNGPDDATGVTVVDTLPAEMTFVSASGGCSEVAGVVTCSIGNLSASASTSVQIIVTAPANPVSLNNMVMVYGIEGDPNINNNDATCDIDVEDEEEPIPTLSEWGMIITSCLLVLTALTVLRRREEE